MPNRIRISYHKIHTSPCVELGKRAHLNSVCSGTVPQDSMPVAKQGCLEIDFEPHTMAAMPWP